MQSVKIIKLYSFKCPGVRLISKQLNIILLVTLRGNNGAVNFRQSGWKQGFPLASQQSVKFTLAAASCCLVVVFDSVPVAVRDS